MNNDEYLKFYENRVKKLGIEKPAFYEGKLAFSNDPKLADNPYTKTNSELTLIWETGWKEAFKARKLFIEETKNKEIREESNIYQIGFWITAVIVFIGIWIYSNDMFTALFFAGMAGMLWPFFWPFVAVIIIGIIGIAYFIYKAS